MDYSIDVYGLSLAARAYLATRDYADEMENLELGLSTISHTREQEQ